MGATSHPCGNLPVSGIHASLYYCWHHQCWWVNVYEILDDGADLQLGDSASYELGPFDQATDALELAAGKLVDLALRSGAPWGWPAPPAA